jgi:hypothetical protein
MVELALPLPGRALLVEWGGVLGSVFVHACHSALTGSDVHVHCLLVAVFSCVVAG